MAVPVRERTDASLPFRDPACCPAQGEPPRLSARICGECVTGRLRRANRPAETC